MYCRQQLLLRLLHGFKCCKHLLLAAAAAAGGEACVGEEVAAVPIHDKRGEVALYADCSSCEDAHAQNYLYRGHEQTQGELVEEVSGRVQDVVLPLCFHV